MGRGAVRLTSPYGVSYQGTSHWPVVSSPQQSMVPSDIRPQLCPYPALTLAIAPVGRSSHWPKALPPQHSTVPSSAMAQVCALPPLTWVKVPSGSSHWPSSGSSRGIQVILGGAR